MDRRSGSLITIRKVEPGEVRVGCDPGGVQVFYKESTTSRGEPNFIYLDELMRGRGLSVRAGDVASDTPFRHLCVSKPDGILSRDEIMDLLATDPEIDLSDVNRTEDLRGG